MQNQEKYRLTGLPIDGAAVRWLAVEAEVDPRSIVVELRAELGKNPRVRGVIASVVYSSVMG
jgi:hypothetical protein